MISSIVLSCCPKFSLKFQSSVFTSVILDAGFRKPIRAASVLLLCWFLVCIKEKILPFYSAKFKSSIFRVLFIVSSIPYDLY
jgi:hypothetical protein